MTTAHLAPQLQAPGLLGDAPARWVSRRGPAIGVVVVSVAVAAAAFAHVERQLHGEIEPRLTSRLGVPVQIGAVAANLSGSVELSDVTVGAIFSAQSVELGASWRSIATGNFGIDEVVVRRFSVAAAVDEAGLETLHGLYARALGANAISANLAPGPSLGGTDGERRALRIVATDGTVRLDYGAHGHVTLHDVDVIPQGPRLRLVTQDIQAAARIGPYRLEVSFARGAADLNVADRRLERALAVAGASELRTSDASLRLTGVTAAVGIDPVVGLRVSGVLAADLDREVIATWSRDDALSLRATQVPLGLLAPLVGEHIDVSTAQGGGEVLLRHALLGRAPLQFEGHGVIQGARLDHPLLASEPIAIDGSGEIAATVQGGTVSIKRYALTLGALALSGDGVIAGDPRDGITALRLAVNVAPVACLDALESLPGALRGDLVGLTPRGLLRGGVEVRFDASKPPGKGASLLASLQLDDCDIVADAKAADPRRLLGIASRRFVDGQVRDVGPGAPGYVALASLPAHVDAAFVTGEDAGFFTHHGFEAEQIARSVDLNFRDGAVVRGGSTISQQLVKNEFLDRKRTLARKFQEAVLTWRLEQVLSKRQILERYLNVIELGPGIWGIEQAAAFWFRTKASQLTPAQAAFLAAITPGPTAAAARIGGADGIDDVTWDRTQAVLRAMRQNGSLSPGAAAQALTARPTLAPAAVATLRQVGEAGAEP